MNDQFFQSVIEAGAIMAGFCGTFLVFRIQREADYYRNPSDGYQGKQHFTSSFLLLILATSIVAVAGVLLPLLHLSGVRCRCLTPEVVVAGFLAVMFLLAGYFVDELFHYRIILRNWRPKQSGIQDTGRGRRVSSGRNADPNIRWREEQGREWRREQAIWVTSLVASILVSVIWLLLR
jgi:hypothetical protein